MALGLKDVSPVGLLFWTEKIYTWGRSVLAIFHHELWEAEYSVLDCGRWVDRAHAQKGRPETEGLGVESRFSLSQVPAISLFSWAHYCPFSKVLVKCLFCLSWFLFCHFVGVQPKAWHFSLCFGWEISSFLFLLFD